MLPEMDYDLLGAPSIIKVWPPQTEPPSNLPAPVFEYILPAIYFSDIYIGWTFYFRSGP